MIRSANAALPSVQIGYTIDGLSVDGEVNEAVMRNVFVLLEHLGREAARIHVKLLCQRFGKILDR